MTRQMVIPGEFITDEKLSLGEGVFKENGGIYSALMGLVDRRENYVRILPLTGRYMPKVGDFVIGKVRDTFFNNWELDINSAHNGTLNADDYYKELDTFNVNLLEVLPPGSTVFVKIREITHSKRIYVTMRERGARVITGGRLLEVVPAKVPRIIGKQRSMVSMIINETGCNVLVGQNGITWIGGKPERINIVSKAIKLIEKEAHNPGLTNRIKDMIVKEREEL